MYEGELSVSPETALVIGYGRHTGCAIDTRSAAGDDGDWRITTMQRAALSGAHRQVRSPTTTDYCLVDVFNELAVRLCSEKQNNAWRKNPPRMSQAMSLRSRT